MATAGTAYTCYWRQRQHLQQPECIYIYGLVDPNTGQIRYIGKTNAPDKRLHLHVSHARKGNKTACAAWIRALLADSKRPAMRIIDTVALGEWQESERRWIMQARALGWSLTNMSAGGGGM